MTSVSGPVLAYNVTGLTADTNYYFVVSAVNGAGEGGKSAVYQTTTGWFGVFKCLRNLMRCEVQLHIQKPVKHVKWGF